ncbi:MAG: magnesium transporter [Chthoniobacterales bacterium]
MESSGTPTTQHSHPHAEIETLVRERDLPGLRALCEDRPAFELAHLLTELSPELRAVAFRSLPKALAADAFEYLHSEQQLDLLRALGTQEAAGILDEMAPDDRTALLEDVPAHVQKQLISHLDAREREIATHLLGYDEHSIGRLMTPDYMALAKTMSVREALDHIHANGRDSETLNVVYVIDPRGKLIDGIRIRKLLLADPTDKIGDLVSHTLISLLAGDSAESAVEIFRQTDLYALPVTSSSGKILGIVTLDDVLDVAEQRATDDMQQVGGSARLELPYLELSVWRMLLKRGPWLIILFFGGLLTANAMAYFDNEIEKAAVLVIFLPLIIASGGNSGSQAATLVIRALAVGELRLRDWFRVLTREILNGLAIGGTLGLTGLAIVSVSAQFNPIFTDYWLHVAATVAVSLTGVVLWGSLVGSMLPLVLRRCGLDPATSSAPFVATFVDVTGIVIYFSVAAFFLRGLLL